MPSVSIAFKQTDYNYLAILLQLAIVKQPVNENTQKFAYLLQTGRVLNNNVLNKIYMNFSFVYIQSKCMRP